MKLLIDILNKLFFFFNKYCSSNTSNVTFNPKDCTQVLVYAYTGLGNFILYTPALKALKRLLPEASFTLFHGDDTGCGEVLGSDYFEKEIIIKRNADWWTRIKWIYRIRKDKYDLIISDFHSNHIFLVFTTMFSAAHYRVGHVSSDEWVNKWDWVYNVRVKMKRDQHEIDRYLEMAYALGVKREDADKKTFMSLSPADEQFAGEFLASNAIADTHRIVSIQIGTSPEMTWKQWSPDNFQTLCDKIMNLPFTKIILHGSANEVHMISNIAKKMKLQPVIAAGKTTIKQAAAIIKASDLLICNDSGLMHVAVAVNTPVVAIYGPTDYKRTAPMGNKHTLIRKDLDCSPCFLIDWKEGYKKCPFDYKCLKEIDVDEVFDIVKTKLEIN